MSGLTAVTVTVADATGADSRSVAVDVEDDPVLTPGQLAERVTAAAAAADPPVVVGAAPPAARWC